MTHRAPKSGYRGALAQQGESILKLLTLWCLVSLMTFLVLLSGGRANAQSSVPSSLEAPKYELRGAWIATVYRLDWPSSLSSSRQKDSMIRLLDYLKGAGINAVFFQIRSFGDAMYDSSFEPWSHYLAGQQGRSPGYDPLKFVIDEAHLRGIEVHAWINPYRAHDKRSGHTVASNHVTVLYPDWLLTSGRHVLLDPGKKEVRDYISTIVMDFVRRYDVDGIHFDDYFYPYPPDHFTHSNSPDRPTFQSESRGFTSIDEWRRDNINLQIAQISDSLRAYDPALKFGISPFGIWKNGVPSGITGLDAYNRIFADPIEWINSKTIDYLVPQLYWPRGGPQDYSKLASWWAENVGDRHLYTGHALWKIDCSTSCSERFSTAEIPSQVAISRDDSTIRGNVFFRAKFIHPFRSRGFIETMRQGLYKYQSLTPPMAWKDNTVPAAPFNVVAKDEGDSVVLTWEVPADSPKRYTIYRVTSDTKPDPALVAQDAKNIVALTGELRFIETPNKDEGKQWYFVRTVSRNSIESEVSNIVASPIATDLKTDPALATFGIEAYPTVFGERVYIEYSLQTADEVTLQVFDSIGREVITLVDDEFRQAGMHTLNFSGHSLSSGVYWVVLSTDHVRTTRAVVRSR